MQRVFRSFGSGGSVRSSQRRSCTSGRKGRARLAILDWTDAVTFHDARIRAALERAGKPIGNLDLMRSTRRT